MLSDNVHSKGVTGSADLSTLLALNSGTDDMFGLNVSLHGCGVVGGVSTVSAAELPSLQPPNPAPNRGYHLLFNQKVRINTQHFISGNKEAV